MKNIKKDNINNKQPQQNKGNGLHKELKNVILKESMYMETRNSKTEMPLFIIF